MFFTYSAGDTYLFTRSLLPGGSTTQTLLPSVKLFSRTINKSDTVRRAKPKDLFGNGTDIQRTKFESIERYATWVDGTNQFRAPVGQFLSPGSPSGYPDDLNAISGQLRAKIRATNLNLAQSLFEYRQTAKLFSDLSADIWKTYQSLRKGRAFYDLARAIRNPRTRIDRRLANRWLQYQYGWKPLMSDIYGVTDALVKKINEGFPQYVRARRDSTIDQNVVIDVSNGSRRSNVLRQVTRGQARYIVRDATIKSLTQCGITNPLLLGWELIPFSFVIDWMVPVGNLLESLDALNGTQSLVWQYSVTQTADMDRWYRGSNSSDTYKRYYRSVPLTNLPLPKLSYQPSTSLTRVLNGLALLTQLRGR